MLEMSGEPPFLKAVMTSGVKSNLVGHNMEDNEKKKYDN